MTIDKEEHKKKMLNILSEISEDPALSVNLGFKGGTCLYFLHGLNRFSVDLDFDLLNPQKGPEIMDRLDDILSYYGELKKEGELKRRVKYTEESVALKVDISDRSDINKLNRYEVKDVVSGVPLRVLHPEDIFAHKLYAVWGRFHNKTAYKVVAHRDLYDINHLFSNNWRFNSDILSLRSGKDPIDYLEDLKELIEAEVEENKILEGLGTLLDDKERNWVRNNLKKEVLKRLSIQIAAMK